MPDVWKDIARKMAQRRTAVWWVALLLAILVLVIAALLYERSHLLHERAQSEERSQSTVDVSERNVESVALRAGSRGGQ